MKRLKRIMFISCLRATELIEKKLHFRISAKEKIQLNLHKMMCEACTRYEKQSAFIEKGISLKHDTAFTQEEINELKQTISEKLADVKKGNDS